MGTFRDHTPIRRNIVTNVTHYRDHKDDLKLDYQGRCGYCNDKDSWRFIWFEIDHFVPEKYRIIIKETDYSNLVYACRSCNNAKRAKWPTENEEVHNENDIGFIDPCDDEYNNQFDRLDSGRIIPKTKLGGWMYNAMKLYKPQHEIIWNIELIDTLVDEIEAMLDLSPDDALKDRLLDVYREYRRYRKSLDDAGY